MLVFSSGRLRLGVNQNPMRVVISNQLDVNCIYPSMTIFDLIRSQETGLSDVYGRIVGFLELTSGGMQYAIVVNAWKFTLDFIVVILLSYHLFCELEVRLFALLLIF